MANFLKCTEEFVKYKRMKKHLVKHEVKLTFLIFKKLVDVYKDIIDYDVINYNNPINIDLVESFSKIKGLEDVDSDYNFIKATERPGINFRTVDTNYYWYYNDEKSRDSQFNDISNNISSYKSRVIL